MVPPAITGEHVLLRTELGKDASERGMRESKQITHGARLLFTWHCKGRESGLPAVTVIKYFIN